VSSTLDDAERALISGVDWLLGDIGCGSPFDSNDVVLSLVLPALLALLLVGVAVAASPSSADARIGLAWSSCSLSMGGDSVGAAVGSDVTVTGIDGLEVVEVVEVVEVDEVDEVDEVVNCVLLLSSSSLRKTGIEAALWWYWNCARGMTGVVADTGVLGVDV